MHKYMRSHTQSQRKKRYSTVLLTLHMHVVTLRITHMLSTHSVTYATAGIAHAVYSLSTTPNGDNDCMCADREETAADVLPAPVPTSIAVSTSDEGSDDDEGTSAPSDEDRAPDAAAAAEAEAAAAELNRSACTLVRRSNASIASTPFFAHTTSRYPDRTSSAICTIMHGQDTHICGLYARGSVTRSVGICKLQRKHRRCSHIYAH